MLILLLGLLVDLCTMLPLCGCKSSFLIAVLVRATLSSVCSNTAVVK